MFSKIKRFIFLRYLLIGNIGILSMLMSCSPSYIEINNALVEQKRYEEAIQNYEELKKDNPYDAEIYYQQAKIYSKINQLHEAKKEIRVAIALAPFQAIYRQEAGMIHYARKEYFQAINSFNSALNLNQNFIQARFYLALTYEKTDKLTLAIDTLNDLIQLDSKFFDAYYHLIRIEYENATNLIDYPQYISRLKKALLLQPNSVLGNILLSNLQLELDRFFLAASILEDWLTQNSPDDRIYFALAKVYYEAGELEKAEEFLSKQTNQDLSSQVLKAHLLIKQSKLAEAKIQVVSLEQKWPNNPQSLLLEVEMDFLEGKLTDSEEKIRNVLLLDENSIEAHLLYSHLLERRFDYTGARIQLDQALTINPSSIRLRFQRLRMLIKEGNGFEVPSLVKFLGVPEDYPFLKELQAEISLEAGNYEESYKLYSEISSAQSLSFDIENKLLMLEIKLKKFYLAKRRIEKLRILQPNNFDFKVNQARYWFYKKEFEKIPKILTPLLNSPLGKGNLHLILAESYFEVGKTREGFRIFEESLGLWRKNPELIAFYTIRLANHGKYQTAIELLEESLESAHPYQRALSLQLSQYYFAVGQKEKAAEILYKLHQQIF